MFEAIVQLLRGQDHLVDGVLARIGPHLASSETTCIAFTLVGSKQVYMIYGTAPACEYPIGLSKPGERVRFFTRKDGRVRANEIRNAALDQEIVAARHPDPRLQFDPAR